MPKQWIGKWNGGRIYQGRDNEKVFVIERMLQGRRYTRRLEAGNEREALAELALFERDPASYATKTEQEAKVQAEIVRLDVETIARFLAYLEKEGRTKDYRKDARAYLAQWAQVLHGRELRTVSLQDLKRALASWPTATKHRIITIKSFFSYLREVEAMLKPGEDPTLSLKVPPARPERASRSKGHTMEEVERVYRVVPLQEVRDVILLRAKTGMHGTEVERLARGEGELTRVHGYGEIFGTVSFKHKSGRIHLQSLDAQSFAAAKRLQYRKFAPVKSWIRAVINRAAKDAGLKPIRIGELRHSFVAWAQNHGKWVRPAEGGVPLSEIASIIGHQDSRTTSRFYDVAQIKPMIALPICLEHPEDPPILPSEIGASPDLLHRDLEDVGHQRSRVRLGAVPLVGHA